MLHEKRNNEIITDDFLKVKSVMSEKSPRGFIGEVFDTSINPINGERTPLHHGFNLVVSSCSTLIAMLMKGETNNGIQYLAVGSGSDNWDDDALPEPTLEEVKLVNETFRKEIPSSNIVFIDEDNNVSSEPTNRIQITIVFLENEANGQLRELGFFGGDATTEKDTGVMINHKIHSSIYKTNGMQLERIVRFTF